MHSHLKSFLKQRSDFATWKALQTFVAKVKLWLYSLGEPEFVAEKET